MKTAPSSLTQLLLIACAATAVSLPLSAAPAGKTTSKAPSARPVALHADLTIDPEELAPDSTIELRFPTPMVAKERVGSAEAESPLIVEPALAGTFEWTSSRSGHYKLAEPPHFNTTYKFRLRPGLADLEGKALAGNVLREVGSAPFRIVDQYPKWFFDYETPRQPRFLLEFNDQVNPAEAAKSLTFVCKEGARVPAAARFATGADFKAFRAKPEPTWLEEVAAVKPAIAEDASRQSALLVEVTQPLPVGTGWHLEIATTLANASGRDTIEAGDEVEIGDIKPFAVTEIIGHTPFDRPYYLDVRFNKQLIPAAVADDAKAVADLAARLQQAVQIDPPVPGLKPSIEFRTLQLQGAFQLGVKYHVTVQNAGVVSGDGLELAAAGVGDVEFIPNPPYVATPAFNHTQLATGAAGFEMTAANVTEVRVRAKKLTGPELMEATEKYQPYERKFGSSDKVRSEFKPEDIDRYPGSIVFDKVFKVSKPLDQSEMIKLDWRQVLGGTPSAPLFVQVDGKAMPGLPNRQVMAQSLVTFTDLGLMQKSNGQETTVFVTSLQTGKPVSGARITLADKDRRLIGYGETDANGIAIVKGADPAFVLAEKDGDATALESSGNSTRIALWNFGIPTAWRSVWTPDRRTLLFSDRPVYKPGDLAHFKAYTRLLTGDTLKLDDAPPSGTLTLRDPRYRVILEKDITATATGSWADDIRLPEGPAGWYELSIDFEMPGDKPADDDREHGAVMSFRIDDYRPNSFEVKFDTQKLELQPDRIRIPLQARYYMGKALSMAKASWSAWSEQDFQSPQGYESYHFGDAPRWAHYGLDRDVDGSWNDADRDEEYWDVSGDVTLSDEGMATLEMPAPPPSRAALPQRVHVSAEVTDINQQTIASSSEFLVPGADFMIGLRGPEFFGRAGQEVMLDAVALTAEGKPAAWPLNVEVKIERQEYHTIRVETAGGGSTMKDQVVLREELRQALVLKPEAEGHAPSAPLAFKPSTGGSYFLTAEATDSRGRKILSRMPFWVIGGDSFPWAMEDGNVMNLQPEKKAWKPGEEASIVVKTPISGTALVTVERNRMHRRLVTQISPANPLVKIPLTEDDAPNVFVSVIVVRGSQDSPKKAKMPEYRVGYCELTVESHQRDLAVEVKADKSTLEPGQTTTVTATVKDATGAAAAGSEVTLYAVDEGVLSLMNYKTPDPRETYHASFPLAIESWTSMDSILPEDFAQRTRGNKGFLVGGGGEEDGPPLQLRKNFIATPLWLASATADAQGQIRAQFLAPDNLSRFRVMAVAAQQADRFGSTESGITVQKPLMVDPVVPRFARLDDELLVKAVVHNTTTFSGEVEVTLELDHTASLIHEQRDFVPVSLVTGGAGQDPKRETRKVKIKAGETTALAFPVRFDELGTAKWKWIARTTADWPQGAPALQDATESTFDVTYPVPELREARYVKLNGGALPENLIKEFSPELLEGNGTVAINVSTSRMLDAQDALDYVLQYPYGCVEQTTSNLMPWLALGGYEKMFPDQLPPAKRKAAIQRGVDNLLRMVTGEGGFAYWPGGNEPSLWGSAYGGFALIKARDMGAAVPQEVVDKLLEYLSKQLRGLEEEKDNYLVADSALALYTLAKGGRPEPAYQTLLFNRRDRLPEIAKLYLALSMLITEAPEAQVKDLLGWKPAPAPEKAGSAKSKKAKSKATVARATPVWTHWLGNKVNKALRLIAYTHLGLTADADKLAAEILLDRNGRGEWGNTYTNAWTLTAMAAYDRSQKSAGKAVDLTALWDSQTLALNLTADAPLSKGGFVLNDKLAQAPLKVEMPADASVMARIEARSWPRQREFAGENKGYGLTRKYALLLPDGSTREAKDLRVGDMVVVTLAIESGVAEDRYLAINDPLPAVFEAVNPEFATQNQRGERQVPDGEDEWFCDHREIRSDRALFFTDHSPGKGTFTLRYLARVIAEGDAIAPPARIEAMYEPSRFGMSPTQRVRTLPGKSGDVAER